MRIYFAPMEGITGHIYRRVHHQFFAGVDRYFTPFLSPTMHHHFTTREFRDVLPEYNEGIPTVPQILTKSAPDFLWAAGELKAMGYEEVNLNLGCPSGTVTAKGKGSGMLSDLPGLEAFLSEVCAHSPLPVSVKTRVGRYDPAEFPALLELFSRFPLCELTIHPRIQKDLYRPPVRMETFALAAARYPGALCYNGELRTAAQCRALETAYPGLSALMLGRGLAADPALGEKLRGGGPANKDRLLAFHTALLEENLRELSPRNTLARMKELWSLQLQLFDGGERFSKPLRKAADLPEYEAVIASLFRTCPVRQDLSIDKDPAHPL